MPGREFNSFEDFTHASNSAKTEEQVQAIKAMWKQYKEYMLPLILELSTNYKQKQEKQLNKCTASSTIGARS